MHRREFLCKVNNGGTDGGKEMKKIKRFGIFMISVLMGITATACAKTPQTPDGGVNPPENPKTTVTQEKLLEKMSGSVYTDNIVSDTFSGLSDESAVGVNKEKFNEVLYPVPADSQFVKIYDVSQYDILPSNKNNSEQFKSMLVDVAKTEGLKKIYFPKGVYNFDSTISFYKISDLYIAGEDTTEWMMTEWTGMLIFKECKNIHINNVDFDYLISPTISGVVQSTDSTERTVTIKVDDEFDMTRYQYNGGKINYGNYMEYVKDENTGDYIPDVSGMLRYNSTGDRVNGIEDGVYNDTDKTLTLKIATVQGAFKAPAVGKVVSAAYTMYEHATITMHDSENFYMESVNIYCSAGMTFSLNSNKNMYFNKTNLMLREGSKRRMTATADGLHTNDCYGDIIVTNSIYEASHDDSMNICTFYKTVNSVSGSVITANASSPVTNFPTNVGDELDIYNLAMEVVGTYTVVDVTKSGLSYDITVDKRVRNVEPGFMVGNITRTPKFVVNNCIFRNKRNRGILAQSQNTEISNCAFVNVIHGPIMLNSAFDIFGEGIIPKNVMIKNNKFISNNQGFGLEADISAFRYGGQIKPSTIKEIKIQNNFFTKSSGYGVSLHSCADSEVKNNLFFNIAQNKADANKSSVYIDISSGTKIMDNCTIFTKKPENFKFLFEKNSTGTVNTGNIF